MGNTNEQNASALQRTKLSSASELISENWIPCNENLLDEILAKADSNQYEENKNEFISEIKSDIGLLTFSIREVSKYSNNKQLDIFDTFRSCSSEKLSSILRSCKKSIAKNRFNNSTSEQLNQLLSLLTSSAVSETLAEAKKANTELAFLSAVFRQIGLVFIAWSYPNIFKNGLASSASEEELSQNLNAALGFSPSMLAIRLAKEWQLPAQVINAIDNNAEENPATTQNFSGLNENGQTNTEESATQQIIKLCKIGELLASLNNDNFPIKAEGSWNHARNEVLKNLGSNGFKLIQENIEKLSRHYINFIPQLNGPGLCYKIVQANKTSTASSLYHSNAYAQFLTSDIQNDLRDFYSLITPEGLSKDSVTFLHSRLIPVMGFTFGCLYLIDPTNNNLQPRLAFGATKTSDYQPIEILAPENSEHPLLKAFYSTTPIPKLESNGIDIKYYCGVLGSLQRAGVLYLELSQALRKNNKVNPMLYFRALVRSFEDCLGLR